MKTWSGFCVGILKPATWCVCFAGFLCLAGFFYISLLSLFVCGALWCFWKLERVLKGVLSRPSSWLDVNNKMLTHVYNLSFCYIIVLEPCCSVRPLVAQQRECHPLT